MRIYKSEGIEVVALQGLDLGVAAGEVMAIIGSSGSGKSTLLNVLGGIDRPSAGTVRVGGMPLLELSERQLTRYRRETVGFVWQNGARNLVPYLSAQENVELPMLLMGARRRPSVGQRRERARELLERVGVGHRTRNRLTELSGGEQQRVAIAVALANRPALLLADEPTGNVDSATSGRLIGVLRHVNEQLGVTVIIVTHDQSVSRSVERVVAIRDGRTSSEFLRQPVAGGRRAGLGPDYPSAGSASHHEYVVIDRVGRLQIPAAHLEALGITGRDRVQVDLDEGKVVVRKPQGLAEQGGEAGTNLPE